MINICTKYDFDSFIISGSYDTVDTQLTMDGGLTTPGVWHKLPTGEPKTELNNLGKSKNVT